MRQRLTLLLYSVPEVLLSRSELDEEGSRKGMMIVSDCFVNPQRSENRIAAQAQFKGFREVLYRHWNPHEGLPACHLNIMLLATLDHLSTGMSVKVKSPKL